jgi:hypothetical protein
MDVVVNVSKLGMEDGGRREREEGGRREERILSIAPTIDSLA